MQDRSQEGIDQDQTVPLDRAASRAPAGGARQYGRAFIGRTLGEYRINKEIGHGSMGIVFEATHRQNGRSVALKILPPSLSVTEMVIQRFLREAQSVSLLTHESIVQIYEVGDHEGVYYYAMQYIEGLPLDQALRERRFSPQECAIIIAQAARALFFAHEHGIIHRDIKPANIILTYKDRPVLTDFGLARPEKAATLTESGALVGTPIYMSPEQVRGERSRIDRRTDIYSLGITFYEMLTGETPYEADSTQEILHKIEHEEPRPARRVRPSVPKPLATICHHAMAKEPEQRYQTANELALDLDRFLAGKPIHARPEGLHTRMLKRARRHRGITALGGLLLVALVILLVSVAQQRAQRVKLQYARYTEHVQRGAGLVRTKKWAEAVREYDVALALDGDQVAPWIERGKCYYMLENHERAVRDFERAIALEPSNGRARLWRGISRLRYGTQAERAAGLTEVGASVNENFDDPECLLQAARIYLELATSYPEARDTFLSSGFRTVHRLLDLDKNNGDALVVQGLLLEEQGMAEQAIANYERAIQLDPQNLEAWALVAKRPEPSIEITTAEEAETGAAPPAPWWGILGTRGVSWAGKRIALDSEMMERAVDALALWDAHPAGGEAGDQPKRPAPPAETASTAAELERLLATATGLWDAADRAGAAPLYEEALEINPKLVEANVRLAEYHLLRHDLDRARRHIDAAREVAPENPRTLLVALHVLSRQDDKVALREVADTIKRYYPGFVQSVPGVSRALESLGGEGAGAPAGTGTEDAPRPERGDVSSRLRFPL